MDSVMIKKGKLKKETTNLLLFSAGKFISIFGTSVYSFAIGLYILKITGSGLSFATNLVLTTIPIIIINPFAGVLADKFDKKKLVVVMDLLNGLLLVILYFISKNSDLSIIGIYVVTFIMTTFTTIFNVSMEAAKPHLVSKDKLMSINSISKILDSSSSIIGPMVGGLVFAFIDIKLFIIINGLSFIVSAILEIFINFRFNFTEMKKNNKKINFIKDIQSGFYYMKSKGHIIGIFMIFILINFFMGLGLTIPIPYIINEVLKLSSKYYGIIQSGFPIGMIIGSLIIKKVNEKIPYDKLLLSTSIVLGVSMIMIGFPLFIKSQISEIILLLYYSFTTVITGVAVAFIDIPIFYILQTTVSDEYRGRVLSIGISIGKIILPFGYLISGLLIKTVDPNILTSIAGITFILSIIVLKFKLNFKIYR
ncbi:MFS transporter [Dethiothermospora halolimnae]|uniref:MFS transporter n=1 Tax=Dethiothermospora halolimnae TaxID=3114390 RepID=UPI003CCB829E